MMTPSASTPPSTAKMRRRSPFRPSLTTIVPSVVPHTTSPVASNASCAEKVQASNSTFYSAAYRRDRIGRLQQKNETINGELAEYEYAYDASGKLTDVASNGAFVAHYDYDSNSNRIRSVSGGGATTVGNYDDQDRLLQFGPVFYGYTPTGELATKTDGTHVTTYSYDAMGNLLSVKLPDGKQIDYVIDAESHRVGRKVNGVMTDGFLYWGSSHPVAWLDAAGGMKARFVYATRQDGVPDYMETPTGTYRLITDHVGSPRLVVDVSSGVVVQRIDYDVWGDIVSDTSPGFQPFGFAGGLWDLDTHLVRFGARDYDPTVGRWTASDPISLRGGMNVFEYVRSDPQNRTDPSGLKPKEFCKRLAEKIENVDQRIRKRIGELDEDPLNLPEGCAGDDLKPSLSRRGHRRLINEDKALLSNLKAQLLAWCQDDDQDDGEKGGPWMPPIPVPDPVKQSEANAKATGTTFLGVLLMGLMVLAL
jgi:RHS repeat-associated protein